MKSINVINGKKERKYLILVIGFSGVGKNTLITSILNIKNKEKNRLLPSELVTYYESKNNNHNFDFLDFDLLINYFHDNSFHDRINYILGFIKSKFKAKEPEKYIDCIWYCISGSRFEAFQRDWINNLRNQFKGIPLLIVVTLAPSKNYLDHMNKYLKKHLNLDLIPVLAKSIRLNSWIRFEAYGKDELIEITIQNCKEKRKNIIDNNDV